MFEDALRNRNPRLLAAAVELHQAGEIPAGTYLIDLDALAQNATHVTDAAHREGLSVVAMTKQFGRHPDAIATLSGAGVDSFVAVDVDCARAIHDAGQSIGHVGHLVQVPQGDTREISSFEPLTWTVVDQFKAEAAASVARDLRRTQPLLARIFGPDDVTTPTHVGGFDAEDVLELADRFSHMSGATFGGLTSYPALAFDRDSRTVRPTSNLRTLLAAREALAREGYEHLVINAPGETTTHSMSMLAAHGATHVEPGHAFTGTTIGHRYLDLPEIPAMTYVTEVSHTTGSLAMVFGGGLYRCIGDAGGTRAFVGHTAEAALVNLLPAELTSADVIDFYGRLRVESGLNATPGDTAVFCFRAQVFYTRAWVAAVSGIQSGSPTVHRVVRSDGVTQRADSSRRSQPNPSARDVETTS